MRSSFALLALVLAPATVAAQDISSHTQAFTLFCVGDAAIGFDKVQGSWTEQRFKPKNHIIKKVLRESELDYPFCDDPRTGKPPTSDGVSVGCYSVAEPGKSGSSDNCSESWAVSGELILIRCSEGLWEFRVNLRTLDYVRSAIYAFANAPDPDSLVLEIGKCSFIEFRGTTAPPEAQ